MKNASPLILLSLAAFLVAAAPLAAVLSGSTPCAGGIDQAAVVDAQDEPSRATWRELSVVERLDSTTAGVGFDSDDYDSCVHDCQRTQTVLTDCHAQCSQQ